MLEKLAEKPFHSILLIVIGTAVLNGMLKAGYDGGVLPSPGVILGVAALFVAWGATRQFIAKDNETAKKWINIVFIVLFFFGGFGQTSYIAYKRFVAPYYQMTSNATSRRILELDLDSSLRINPTLTRARRNLAAALQGIDNRFSKSIGDRATQILKSLGPNPTSQQMDGAIVQINVLIEETAKKRADLRKINSKLIGSDNDLNVKKASDRGWFSETINNIVSFSPSFRLLLLGTILLAIAILCSFFKKLQFGGRRLLGWTGAIIILVIMVLWLLPEAQGKITEFIQQSIKSSTPAQAAPRPVVFKRLRRVVGTIPPRHIGYFEIRGATPSARYNVVGIRLIPMENGEVQRKFVNRDIYPPSKRNWQAINASGYQAQIVVEYMAGHFIPSNVIHTKNVPLDS